jgi:hypothetical protein
MNDYYKKLKKEEEIMIAAYNFLYIIQENLLIPGKIESWVVIMDFSELSLFKLPLKVITSEY